MGNFNISSFAELMLHDNSKVGLERQNDHAKEKPQTSTNGVFIQDVKGRLWKTEDWDNSVKPNAIAVVADEAKFLIALCEFDLRLSDSSRTKFEEYVFSASCPKLAISDYDGAKNTVSILKAQPSAEYAAGRCNAFIFPDDNTKGFLPSLGQLYLAYQNKSAVNAALSKCGGTAMTNDYYWSSTFLGVDDIYRYCWELGWYDCKVKAEGLYIRDCVRPFANLT